jgi:osmoprotectant transport system ATP-binding protein
VIEFRSVTKRFPGSGGADGTDVTAVDELDLTVESGSLTVFVGPSGCGKTTSLRMINRMVTPTSGQILVDGRDVMAGDAAELRRGIGYVIQQAGLFPHRTVLDNVATVPLLLGRTKREARARAAELMELVGLDAGMAKRYPAQLSGGQQQRVGVARALAADPPVLLMDEPFSAVDPVVRVNLQDELLRLQSELGKTIVFVTHDIDEAVKLGDRVAVFRVGGRLAQYAEPGELLAHPVDEFVDAFVGRDRGYRGLGFRAADQLRLGELPTVASSVLPEVPPGWHLVLDDDGKPRTWYRGANGVAAGEFPVGSLYPVGAGTLRVALDAALSSPSGLGVAVDAEGRVVGSVSAEDVMRELAATRDAH